MNFDFRGKRAVVTGGTRGIGKQIAGLFFDLGADVVYTGTKGDFHTGNSVHKQYFQLDLSDELSTQGFIRKMQGFPRIDILVNNAGINIISPIDHINHKDWDKILRVNLTNAMQLMKAAAENMKSNGIQGHILNISSIFGLVSKAKRNSYSASKFGLIGLTKASALDLAEYNIMVNALCPGFVLTDMTRSILSVKEREQLSQQIPLGRFAAEPEIARAAVFLCSEWNSYMTGQTFVIDGGFIVR